MYDKLLPPPCKSGDRVAIIAPAGPFQEQWLHAGCDRLKEWGLEPVYAKELFSRWGYLAGEDEVRLRLLVEAFEDDNVKAILCARGGYGSFRLLEKLPIDAIKQHPKRFFGFSDITMLHQLFMQAADMITFHGPMAASQHFVEGSPQSVERLHNALFGQSLDAIFPPLEGKVLQEGRATGRLVGGNLSLIASSIGTPWEIDTQDAILFLEEVAEPPYRLDRMWQQLRYSGVLESIKGLALGDFGLLKDQYTTYPTEEFWHQRMGLPKGIPVLYDLPFGHIRDNATLPVGASVVLDSQPQTLQIST